ncbi:ABC transporter substrate-binding protein [Bosea sp. BK604]|uniref:ABC transporter substrate-binding protein n=1 Tax=Bosea sp. BK604 TaxID=2512180 RepID=UPI001044777F|nr:ABC transporter substrate-binding protein [Bosea sp. BK604]TCR60801.1 NitT/TauT family transport system substrate-binding protein [Bosea sp. BK604]
MFERLKYLAAISVAAGAVLGATVVQAADKVVYALTTTNISVGNAAQSSVPLGMEYWKKEGLDVSVIGLAGTMLGVQQIATGAVQFATAGPETVMIARQKGLPIVAVYVMSTPIYETVVTDDKIKSFKDLKGMTIGLPEMASGSLPYARSAVKDAGLDPDKDVKFISVGLGSSAANAIRQKEIAAWSVWDTGVSALENSGFKFTKIDPPWLSKMPGNVIITHEDLVKNHPEVVVKFLRGLAKATAFSLANPEATIRNHWAMYPATKPQEVTPKTFADSVNIYKSRASRMVKSPGRKWGESVDAEWDNILRYSVEPLGGTEAMRASYTNRFIDEVNKFDDAAVDAEAKASKW